MSHILGSHPQAAYPLTIYRHSKFISTLALAFVSFRVMKQDSYSSAQIKENTHTQKTKP